MTPTPDTRADVARIAAKLTKAQREAVLGATYSDGNGVWHPAGWYATADRRVRYRLALYNLTWDYLRPSNDLTPLGLAVRAYLQEQRK